MTAAGAPGRRRLHLALRLCAVQVGLAVLVLLGELVARSLTVPPAGLLRLPDPDLWGATADGDVALRPCWTGVSDGGGGGDEVLVTTNALGMRDREFAAKAEDERRLLLLGDEVVFGTGVAAEQALPARLQQALADRGEAWTVGNGGVPRYGSRHAAQQLARLDAAFAPDAVVWCGNLGDDTLDDREQERTVYTGLLLRGPQVAAVQASWRARLVCRSALARWIDGAWADEPLFAPLPVALPEVGERTFAGLFLDVGDGDPSWQGRPPQRGRWLEPLRASLRTMRDRADRRPLLFVVVPTRWQLGEGERQAALRRLGFRPLDCPRGAGQQRWLAVAAELGVAAVDATPALAAEPDPAALFAADGLRLSALGHAALARWLAGALAASPR